MDNELDSILREIYIRASALSSKDLDHLISALAEFASLLRIDDRDRSVSDDLARIDKYFGRFRSASYGRAANSSSEELLIFARSSGHGKWRFSKFELRRLQEAFWRALESNADVWEPKELSNLLSYSLRKNIRVDFARDTTSRTVARLYHEYFRSLAPSERDAVFEELLQRVLSEPEFRHSLVEKERTK